MAQQLTVLLLESNSQQTREIGTLVGERIVIGRECPGGITVDVAGVSRSHGEFFRVRSQYLFRDLGSTNGSWVNGRRVDPNRPTVVRAGDTLQIAAAALEIGSGGGVKSEVPSLLVIRRGAPTDAPAAGQHSAIEEFPIPAAGVVITLGGTQSDVDDCADELAARVLKEDGGLTLELISQEAMLNGVRPSAPRVPIGDNDVISVGNVSVLINIPPRINPGAAVRAGGVFGTAMVGKERNDVAQTAAIGAGAIESQINPEATTAVFDSATIQDSAIEEASHLATGDVHPGQCFGGHSELQPNSLGLSPLEVKLVVVMVFMLLASVFLLGIWWFSQNK